MHRTALGALACAVALSTAQSAPAVEPANIVPGTLSVTVFDGISNDLLTGGLGATGLAGAAPAFADPLNPTVLELRTRAIHANYRGIIDVVAGGGYGLLFGPALAPVFPGVPQGHIPGLEYKAYVSVPGSAGRNFVTVLAQVPAHFDPDAPCIVTAPPSGSRGIYGGIGVAEWALIKGCAVAMTDKGTGTGFHLLGSRTVYDIDGVAGPKSEITSGAQFRIRGTPRTLRYLEAHPDRVATKHAHSRINPERLWGSFVLQSIDFTFRMLNQQFSTPGNEEPFRPKNTIVIAAGVSNGGGAAIRAVEADSTGLIDGAVVTEPNLAPDSAGKFVIRFDDADFAGHGDSLYGAITLMSLYAPCAALDGSLAGSPLFGLEPLTTPAIGFPARANRCASLHDSGLLSATALADQAKEALDRIRAYGYLEEAVRLLASHEWLSLWRSLQATYAPAYGGFGFSQRHCGTSFAATDTTGLPKPVPVETAERLFATSSGIPATDGINVIADNAQGGPIHENLARSASSGRQDLNADGARCFRYLATGDGNLLPNPPSPAEIVRHEAVIAGLEAIKMTGDLGGRPAIIIHGRSDALVFPNQHSRPYFGLNQIVEGGSSRLSYVEVTDAQHFDTFISGLLRNPVTLAVEYAPLHFYLTEGLELMLAHLRDPSQPLPASQVVRPTPRGAAAYEAGNVAALLPDIPITPAPADAISFAGGVLNIPK